MFRRPKKIAKIVTCYWDSISGVYFIYRLQCAKQSTHTLYLTSDSDYAITIRYMNDINCILIPKSSVSSGSIKVGMVILFSSFGIT